MCYGYGACLNRGRPEVKSLIPSFLTSVSIPIDSIIALGSPRCHMLLFIMCTYICDQSLKLYCDLYQNLSHILLMYAYLIHILFLLMNTRGKRLIKNWNLNTGATLRSSAPLFWYDALGRLA